MKIYGTFDLQNNLLKNTALDNLSAFPENPRVGSFQLIQKRLMVCLYIDESTPFWFPIGSEISTFIHTQDEENDTWVLNHNLGSSTVIVQTYDTDNKVILADDIDLSVKNVVTITFSVPLAGRAIVMLGNLTGLPKPDVRYEKEFTLSKEWTVNHGLGYLPVIRVIKDGLELQPESIFHESTVTSTVTFSKETSGLVIAI
jgi:hypothetical protein